MRVVFTILFGYWLGLAFGQQPPICGNNPAMTSLCAQACIICDIDGFTGRNNSSIKGQAPPDFCTSYVHHMQWIGFIAGTSTLTLEVKVSNCARNNGLEIGLYESLDCQTFRRISDCDTDIQPGKHASSRILCRLPSGSTIILSWMAATMIYVIGQSR